MTSHYGTMRVNVARKKAVGVKTLAELFQGLPHRVLSGSMERTVRSIQHDSRSVEAGDVFVALPGTHIDGHHYVQEAIEKGASAVVGSDLSRLHAVFERWTPNAREVTVIGVPSTRHALNWLLDAFYDHPTRDMEIIAVTGTNGKTTTTTLLYQLLTLSGYVPGLIGTIEIAYGGKTYPASHTTPDPVSLFQTLAEMKANGVQTVVMEASSHALDQGRVHGLRLKQAIFTNLTQDHLDYHGTMDAYLAAKARLFALLGNDFKDGKAAIVNAGDPSWEQMARMSAQPIVRYAVWPEAKERNVTWAADVVAYDLELSQDGTTFFLDVLGKTEEKRVFVPLLGAHNVENTLAALTAAYLLGVPFALLLEALPKLKPVRGRLERIPCAAPFSVLVDYAHTPDGIGRVLQTLKALTPGRLISVFGAGGDRDAGKRPLMGEKAAEVSDLLVITSDNPRSEIPEKIIEDVARGIPPSRKDDVLKIPVREEAIRTAILKARAGDTVAILGKGHETTQEIGGIFYPFDDARLAQMILSEVGYPCSSH